MSLNRIPLLLLPAALATLVLAGCDAGAPAAARQAEGRLRHLGEQTEASLRAARVSAEEVRRDSQAAGASARAALASAGEAARGAGEVAADTLTAVGGAAQAGTRRVAGGLAALGERVQALQPVPESAPERPREAP